MDKLTEVTYRPFKSSTDDGFVFSYWLNNLRYSNSFFDAIPHDIYFSNYSKIISTIINRPQTTVRIACLKEDEDVIVGFSAFDERALHYVYVKDAWRSLGIGHALLPDPMPKYATHLVNDLIWDRISKKRIKKLPLNLIFNPFNL